MKEQTWQQWCRAVERDPYTPSKLRKGSLAALTGTDVRALDAFVPTLKLYAYTGDDSLLHIAGLLTKQMQESTRWIARELIPFAMNWEDRERLWPRMERAFIFSLSDDDVLGAPLGGDYP